MTFDKIRPGLAIWLILFWVSINQIQAQLSALTIAEAVSNPAFLPTGLKQLGWRKGTSQFYYVKEIGGTEYLLGGNTDNSKTDTLFVAPKLGQTGNRLPAITWIDANRFHYQMGGSVFIWDVLKKAATEMAKLPSDAENVEVDPEGKRVSFTEENNVSVFENGKLGKLTTESNKGIVCGQSVHRNEFGITKGLFWSRKGNRLAFYRMDESMVTDYPLQNLKSYPASPKPIKYPMAGQKSHQVTVGVYDAQTGKTIYLQTGQTAEQYLTNVVFSPDEKTVYIALLNREQNRMDLNSYNAQTGNFVKTLFTETHSKYVEPLEPMLFVPGNDGQFVWQSNRDGFNHLYLYSTDGKVLKQLTSGSSLVTEVSGFSTDGNLLFYTATANNGLDRQFYQVNVKNGKSLQLSTISGTHSCYASSTGDYFLDSYSNISTPRTIDLVKVGKGVISKLFEAPNPLASKIWSKPEPGTIKADDGTELNTMLIRPSNFNPAKKYPVLVYVYGGPHVQLVTNTWLAGSNLWLNYMAQKGYIVFTVDSRGSGNRGRDFENATFRQLGTIEMSDQMKGVSWLKKQPFVDSTRLGVYGWSFGGFMTTSLMCRFPKTFKVGVAGGPVIDWALYEVMYTERYMDTPMENPEGYERSNLLNHAKNLEGRLLMIHGTNDDVVVWQHSQLFVKKCVDEGKLLDYFIYPGHAHNVRGKDRLHLMRKISQYFEDYL